MDNNPSLPKDNSSHIKAKDSNSSHIRAKDSNNSHIKAKDSNLPLHKDY
jgi:hypothetical protein